MNFLPSQLRQSPSRTGSWIRPLARSGAPPHTTGSWVYMDGARSRHWESLFGKI